MLTKLLTNCGLSEKIRRRFTVEFEATSVQQTAQESGILYNNVQTVPDAVRVV